MTVQSSNIGMAVVLSWKGTCLRFEVQWDIKLGPSSTNLEIAYFMIRWWPNKTQVLLVGCFLWQTVFTILMWLPACELSKTYDKATLHCTPASRFCEPLGCALDFKVIYCVQIPWTHTFWMNWFCMMQGTQKIVVLPFYTKKQAT